MNKTFLGTLCLLVLAVAMSSFVYTQTYIPPTGSGVSATLPAGSILGTVDTGSPNLAFGPNSATFNVPLSIGGSPYLQWAYGSCPSIAAGFVQWCPQSTGQAAGIQFQTPTTEGQGQIFWSLSNHILTGSLIAGSGTALSSSNFGSATNWGSGATFVPVGNVGSFKLTITAGTGPGADPTITLTYPSTISPAPNFVCGFEVDATSTTGAGGLFYPLLPNTTGTAFELQATPTASKIYVFNCRMI